MSDAVDKLKEMPGKRFPDRRWYHRLTPGQQEELVRVVDAWLDGELPQHTVGTICLFLKVRYTASFSERSLRRLIDERKAEREGCAGSTEGDHSEGDSPSKPRSGQGKG